MDDKKPEKFDEIAGILKVLGHPDRLRILACLMEHECYVKDLSEKLGLPQSTVSQHLRILTDRGILVNEREGVKICYRPADSIAKAIAELILPGCKV